MATLKDSKHLGKLKDFLFCKIKLPKNPICREVFEAIYSGTDLKKLTGNYKPFKELALDSVFLKKLPENLRVKGNLNIEHTDIKELPKSLKVGGIIYCSYGMGEMLRSSLKTNGNSYINPEQIVETGDYPF